MVSNLADNFGLVFPNTNCWQWGLGIVRRYLYIVSGKVCCCWVVFHHWNVKAKLSAWLNITRSKWRYIFSFWGFGWNDPLQTFKSNSVFSNLWSELSVYLFCYVWLLSSMYTVQTSVHMRCTMMLICACVHAWLLAKCAIWPMPSATMQTVYCTYMFNVHGG